MCYTRRKIEGGVGTLRESDDTNFLEPNGQSRNLDIHDFQPFQIKLSITICEIHRMKNLTLGLLQILECCSMKESQKKLTCSR